MKKKWLSSLMAAGIVTSLASIPSSAETITVNGQTIDSAKISEGVNKWGQPTILYNGKDIGVYGATHTDLKLKAVQDYYTIQKKQEHTQLFKQLVDGDTSVIPQIIETANKVGIGTYDASTYKQFVGNYDQLDSYVANKSFSGTGSLPNYQTKDEQAAALYKDTHDLLLRYGNGEYGIYGHIQGNLQKIIELKGGWFTGNYNLLVEQARNNQFIPSNMQALLDKKSVDAPKANPAPTNNTSAGQPTLSLSISSSTNNPTPMSSLDVNWKSDTQKYVTIRIYSVEKQKVIYKSGVKQTDAKRMFSNASLPAGKYLVAMRVHDGKEWSKQVTGAFQIVK